MEQLEGITWEIRENIGIITLDNPPKNLIPAPEFIPLKKLMQWTAQDELRGILITGAGRQFSAGGDLERLRKMAHDKEPLHHRMTRGKKVLDHLEHLDIPVVSAIQGACFGGGLEIALASHIRICSDQALFAFPETNHNLMPGLGGTVRSMGQLGYAKSLQMILGGDLINAREALEIGLVDFVVPRKEVYGFAFSYLQKMVGGRPLRVIRSVMTVLGSLGSCNREEVMKLETKLFCELAREEARSRRTEKKTGNDAI
jgi:enoyl-CoA hydratase